MSTNTADPTTLKYRAAFCAAVTLVCLLGVLQAPLLLATPGFAPCAWPSLL